MKIDVVLVTYNPNLELLFSCIESLKNYCRNIYIIDNNSDNLYITDKTEKIKFIKLEDNMGIAFAQNIGIKESLKNNVDYILLSDQDTIYPDNYIINMLKIFSNDYNICAVAPLFKDVYNIKPNEGFYIKSFLFTRRIYPNAGYYEIFHTIASGKIIKAKFLVEIGLMDEKLFIDWVDYSWCWKARSKGYKIIGNADVIIKHKLGDKSSNIGFREVNIRNYVRHYYITRNAFYLALYSKDLDIRYKIILLFRSFRYLVGYPMLAKDHLVNLKYVLLGFWHGINKKLGKLK